MERLRQKPALSIYIIVFVASIILPYSQFLPWFVTNGLDLPRFMTDLFSNRIGGFFGWDVIVGVVALWVVAIRNPQRFSGSQRGLLALCAALGAASGLAMYLLLLEWNRVDVAPAKR